MLHPSQYGLAWSRARRPHLPNAGHELAAVSFGRGAIAGAIRMMSSFDLLERPSCDTPVMVFYDTEFTNFSRNADLLSIGLVAAEGSAELYIEIKDANLDASSDFVKAIVLPQFGKHHPKVLRRVEAASRITEWLDTLRNGDPQRQLQMVSDSIWDWQLLSGLYVEGSGNATWPALFNAKCRLILSVLAPGPQSETFAETIEQFYCQRGEQHHALVDARALREAWRMAGGSHDAISPCY
jgi:hypothetical protein